VRQEIKRSGYEALLPAGVVLTGGTSSLPGIRDVAADVLNLPVRLGRPGNLRGMVDQLRSPAYSASMGMLRWAQMVVEERRGEGGAYGLVKGGFDLRRAVNDLLWRLLPG
jgi:cell division protein FtsA